MQARRPASECARALGHQQCWRCTRTSQCRSWRQWERRYGQRPCSARSMRCSWQANTLIPILPFPFPYLHSPCPRARLHATSLGRMGRKEFVKFCLYDTAISRRLKVAGQQGFVHDLPTLPVPRSRILLDPKPIYQALPSLFGASRHRPQCSGGREHLPLWTYKPGFTQKVNSGPNSKGRGQTGDRNRPRLGSSQRRAGGGLERGCAGSRGGAAVSG